MNKEAKDIQLFGKVVSRHGQPLAGVGIALLETFPDENPDRKKSKPDAKANEETAPKQRVVATAVSDSNGLFIINASIPENITGAPYSLQVSTSKNAVELPELQGGLSTVIPGRLYGPLTIVADQDKPTPKNAVTHRPVLIASEEEILAAIKRAPGLFFKAQAARSPDPCSPYSPLGVPSRIVRYSGTVRFPSPTREQLDSNGDTSVGGLGRLFPITHDAPRTSIAELIRWGFVGEIEQAWFDLGLGLGNLLYSVPLAPCEETKFAIVDWRRKDWARRQSAVDESHFQDTTVTRDQIVDETVRMTSHKEASATTSTEGFGLALGPLTLGRGSTSSMGTEDVTSTVDAHRQVNDRTNMASQTVRHTRAFAIVEATQEEESVVRTRVLRNHNHCHTITFQYFEVLQHFLIAARERRRRPVLFLRMAQPVQFTIDAVSNWAYLLRRALLDTTLGPALDRVLGIAEANKAERVAIEGAAPEGQKTIVKVIRVSATTGPSDNPLSQLSLLVLSDEYRANSYLSPWNGSFPFTWGFDKYLVRGGDQKPLPALEDINRITLLGHPGKDANGNPKALALGNVVVEADVQALDSNMTYTVELAYWENLELKENQVASKQLRETVISAIATKEPLLENESDFQIRRLLKHLNANQYYYTAAILAGTDPGERMYYLEQLNIGGKPLSELVENAIVGVDGYYMAFPLRDPLTLPQEYWGVENVEKPNRVTEYLKKLENPSNSVNERLITLPTPGVFAESQLGACCACEKIDDTRFWDWQKSPCPDEAPDITSEMLASRYQSPASMLEFVKPGLTPEKLVFPQLPKPMITIGDATLANLTKGLQLQDAAAVTQFVSGLVNTSAEGFAKVFDALMQLFKQEPSGGPGSGTPSPTEPGGPAPDTGLPAEGGELPVSGSASAPAP